MSIAEVSMQQPDPNQIHSAKEPSGVYYEGIDWWGICNNSLVRSYISQPCETLVTPDHRAITPQGKAVLERILCPKDPSVLLLTESASNYHGTIPGIAHNTPHNQIACSVANVKLPRLFPRCRPITALKRVSIIGEISKHNISFYLCKYDWAPWFYILRLVAGCQRLFYYY